MAPAFIFQGAPISRNIGSVNIFQWIFFSEYFLGCANLSEYWISEWQWKNLISRVSSTQWNQNIHVTFMTFVTFIYVTFVTFIFVNIQGWCQKLAPLSKSKLDNWKIWFQEDQTIIKYYELFVHMCDILDEKSGMLKGLKHQSGFCRQNSAEPILVQLLKKRNKKDEKSFPKRVAKKAKWVTGKIKLTQEILEKPKLELFLLSQFLLL